MSRRKRLLFSAAGALVAASLLAGLVWVGVNSRDIAASDVSDLLPETWPVPHSDNAYRYLREAAARFKGPDDSRAGLSPEEWDDALIGNVLSRNGEVLTLLEQACVCPGYRAESGTGPDSWLRLSLFLAQKAAYERRIGLSDVACESSCCLLRLGAWITFCPRSLAEWFDGAMALRLGLEGVERLLRSNRFGEADLTMLLERLNRAEISDRGLAEAFKREFQSVSEAIDACAVRYPGRSLVNVYRFQPNRTRESFARFYRRMIQNVPLLPADVRVPRLATSRVDGIHGYLLLLRPNRQGRVLGEIVTSPLARTESCFETRWQIQSRWHGLRLVAACRIYELRHGRLPETLDTLVPELLETVPRDPYDGKPFPYVRDQALVYSIGGDLKDSGGAVERVVEATPVFQTAEPSDDPNWPAYPPSAPRSSLLTIPSRTGDLVYSLRPETP
mgnify:CR=1 FL=1